MDWYPLWNSLRIALISCAAVFFLGIFAAYYIAKLPRVLKGCAGRGAHPCPMVLPPTVVGYFLLLLFGAKRPLGLFFLEHFGVKLVMNWYSAIFASIVVAFPLMYRTAPRRVRELRRDAGLVCADAGAFQHLDLLAGADALLPSGHPGRNGAGLCHARWGEYGATSMIAGYTPGKNGHHRHHGVSALAHQR